MNEDRVPVNGQILQPLEISERQNLPSSNESGQTSQEDGLSCQECGTKLANQEHFESHMKLHERHSGVFGYECP